MNAKNLFRDESGFTTVGVVLALLITLSLIFSAGQVYRINTLSSEIQSVADVAALAAENEIAEFMIVVKVCDAIALSLSLTSLIATAIGVVALCVPACASVGEALLVAAEKVSEARDSFVLSAAENLNSLQRLLPFFVAVQAASVASANNNETSDYLALAVLAPSEGEEITIDLVGEIASVQEEIAEESSDLAQTAQEAELAAQEALESKLEAFEHDCGLNPSYCMYERADSLASLSTYENPLYQSVDTWSFSVAFERAQAYYSARLEAEEPESDSVESIVQSVLRSQFYAYALEQFESGYVEETDDSFKASFPHLPQNTSQMRETDLYTNEAYPCSVNEDGSMVMHAWDGCEGITSIVSYGSLSQMESESYETCEVCGLTAASLGRVAAASSVIDNGFEYHYEIVASAADEYEQVRAEADPLVTEAKETVEGLFDSLFDVLESVSHTRIDASPPGSLGVVVLVVNMAENSVSSGFESSFVSSTGVLGVRIALSAATLVADPAGEGEGIIASFLDGFVEDSGILNSSLDLVLNCWSGLLSVYSQGSEALISTVSTVLDGLFLTNESGLGVWAAQLLEEKIESIGLEPANLDALKPVLVNSAHIASADESEFSAQLLSLKEQALTWSEITSSPFNFLTDLLGLQIFEDVSFSESTIEVAAIEVSGSDGLSIPLEIALPTTSTSTSEGFVDNLSEGLENIFTGSSGAGEWQ